MITFFYLLAFSALLVLTRCAAMESEEPVVKIPSGTIMGHYIKSYKGRVVSAFEGIPYAKPPVGELRFQEPKPVEVLTNTLVANTTYVCMQFLPVISSHGLMGEEDCLYLYVYVPRANITGNENLDVIVHIHGGAFMLGAPKYMCSPDYIMDKEVVFVSFNYRLGILGFLSTEDDIVPGNNGLKDQVMALRWIKDNIKYFGGNSDSITITGLSAGGSSVQYHYMSSMTKGLFHRGFSQSGTALNPWALTEKPLEKAKRLAASLECPQNSTKLMVECLKKKPVDDLILLLKNFMVFINVFPIAPFGPVIEKGSNANTFLRDHPYKLLLDGKVHDLPWVNSNTKEEGIYPVGFFVMYRKLQEVDKRWNELMPTLLEYNDTVDGEDIKIEIAEKVRNYYMSNESLSMENNNKLVNLFTERLFLIDGETAMRLHAKASKSPVYYYFFDYRLKMNSVFGGKIEGSAHADDGRLLYRIFGNAEVLPDTDKQMKDIFIDFLYSFATQGKPTFKGIEWVSINPTKDIDYLHVGGPDNIQMKKINEFADKAFWDKFPIKENEYLCKN